MTQESKKIFNIIQLVSEISVIVFYILSIAPGAYYMLFLIIIPLISINLVFGLLKKDETVSYSSVNLAMSLLAFIPVFGWLAIFLGIFLSLISAQFLTKELSLFNETTVKTNDEAKNKQKESVEIKTVKVSRKHKNTQEDIKNDNLVDETL